MRKASKGKSKSHSGGNEAVVLSRSTQSLVTAITKPQQEIDARRTEAIRQVQAEMRDKLSVHDAQRRVIERQYADVLGQLGYRPKPPRNGANNGTGERRAYVCGKCGKEGHNSRKCPEVSQ